MIWLTLAACGAAAAPVDERVAPKASPPPGAVGVLAPADSAPCSSLPADAEPPHAGFALAHSDALVRVYRVDAAACAVLVATIDIRGDYAFASLQNARPGGMPELSVDTWLAHGDRLRRHFAWVGDKYAEDGPEQDIPGPGKWRPHSR